MTEEIKNLNVKNVSLRLVHIGGVAIAPNAIRRIVDDPAGVNRNDVEGSEFLELTDEPSVEDLQEVEAEATADKVSKAKAKSKTEEKPKSATGAQWGATK